MREIAMLLAFVQIALAGVTIFRGVRSGTVFALGGVMSLSLLFYISVPVIICAQFSVVYANAVLIPVNEKALLLASAIGTVFAAFAAFLRTPRFEVTDLDIILARRLFVALFALNTITLLNFARSMDVGQVLQLVSGGAVADYRDLAYATLVENDTGLGYVPKVLQIALFGLLWLDGKTEKRLLLAGVAPVVLLDFISLGRHTIASFLFVLFFCLERGRWRKALYIGAPLTILLLFFMRILIYSQTDSVYTSWLQQSFQADVSGVEILGEFFNTFVTLFMVESLPNARFTGGEIVNMIGTQLILPPGFSGVYYSEGASQFPLFRITDEIKTFYGPHPAHAAFADIYTFGAVAAVFFAAFLLLAWRSTRGRAISAVTYFYMLAMFYLPFRGSLSLNTMRFGWLLVVLGLVFYGGRALVSRRSGAIAGVASSRSARAA